MMSNGSVHDVRYATEFAWENDAVALIDLEDLSSPRVVSLCAVADNANASGPEGVLHVFDAERQKHYILTANEGDGSLTVLRID